jgi:CubicO group peptidase (beta-lactamase class C family)
MPFSDCKPRKWRIRVNFTVRWGAEFSPMMIRNPNVDSRKPWLSIIAVLSVLSLPATAFAQQPAPAASIYAPSRCGSPVTPTPSDAIDRAVVAWMLRSRTPGASLAIVRHGQVIKEQAYGWADLTNCLPATLSMRFGIGSISKQITAFGTLILVQRGKLLLDDPVSRFFPESGAAWKGITVRHLLTHTSGIRDTGHDDPVYPQIEFDKKQSITEAELITRLAAAPLNFSPGDQFAYSNTGYLLLSLIIQRVGESPFPDWMHKNVFEPLGMHDTRFYDSAEIIPALARGYTIDNQGGLRTGYYASNSYSRWGDMGIISTAHDMALWTNELKSSHLINASLHAAVLAHAKFNDGTTFPYGFGVILDDYRGEPLLWHAGTYSTGYSAQLVTFPERDLALVLLTNQHQGDPWAIATSLVSLIDPTIQTIATLSSEQDRVPERTRGLEKFLNGDTTAVSSLPNWLRIDYPRVHSFVTRLVPLTVEYITCDDVSRRKLESFGGVLERECYYRLRHGETNLVIGVFYTADGRIAMIYPRL